MKKSIIGLLTLFMTAGSAVWAQETGKISYQVVTKFNIGPIEGMDSAMLVNFPSENTTNKELYFDSNASIYVLVKKEQAAEDLLQEKSGIVIKIDEPDEKMYCDLKKKNRIEQRDFMSRKFIVESPMNQFNFKLSGKQKQILGFACQEAIISDSIGTISVWFSPQLKAQVGPGVFSGFPGTVLEVNINDGQDVITATNVQLGADVSAVLVKPTEGKKMSPQKFEAMVLEKTKEMQEQYGGDGNTVIKIIHN